MLKPKTMLKPGFDPHDFKTFDYDNSCRVSVHIFSARHLAGRGMTSAFVEVQLSGVDEDRFKYKTKTVEGMCCESVTCGCGCAYVWVCMYFLWVWVECE